MVRVADVRVHFLHAGAVAPEHLGYALNGAVVGLAVAGGSGGARGAHAPATVTGSLSTPLALADAAHQQQQQPPWCVGLGLVRGVDMERGELLVLTPTALEQLEQVRARAQGNAAVPHCWTLRERGHGGAQPGSCGQGCVLLWLWAGS